MCTAGRLGTRRTLLPLPERTPAGPRELLPPLNTDQEAVAGAVMVDSGFDVEATWGVFQRLLQHSDLFRKCALPWCRGGTPLLGYLGWRRLVRGVGALLRAPPFPVAAAKERRRHDGTWPTVVFRPATPPQGLVGGAERADGADEPQHRGARGGASLLGRWQLVARPPLPLLT